MQNPEFKIFADFKILAFENPEFKIFADFKIPGFVKPQFEILADFKILAFHNPEFKILADFKILAFQKVANFKQQDSGARCLGQVLASWQKSPTSRKATVAEIVLTPISRTRPIAHGFFDKF